MKREYVGKGEVAALICQLEKGRQEEKKAKEQREKTGRLGEGKLEAQVSQFAAQTELWRRLTLWHHGFHQHARGAWRRQRGKKEDLKMKEIKKSNDRSGVLTAKEDWAQFVAGAHQNADGAEKFLAEAERVGNLDNFLAVLADLGVRAQTSLIQRVVKEGDPLSAAAFARKIERMTKDLQGPQPSELEKQLAQRIVLEWLLLTYFEATLTVNFDSEKWTTYYEKRVESAQRRYLSSVKTLAQIRKLQLPNLQINVAERQVNQQLNG